VFQSVMLEHNVALLIIKVPILFYSFLFVVENINQPIIILTKEILGKCFCLPIDCFLLRFYRAFLFVCIVCIY
jgi:hypothetical protein